jgi:hypothetical protein
MDATLEASYHPKMISTRPENDSYARPRRIEGYAIVSEDGMLANAAGIMPDSLKFEADRHFFERGLDGVNVVVHGRHSHERQPRSYLRRRLILTRQVSAIAADPSNEKALFWNPAGASFEQALAVLGTPEGSVGVIRRYECIRDVPGPL